MNLRGRLSHVWLMRRRIFGASDRYPLNGIFARVGWRAIPWLRFNSCFGSCSDGTVRVPLATNWLISGSSCMPRYACEIPAIHLRLIDFIGPLSPSSSACSSSISDALEPSSTNARTARLPLGTVIMTGMYLYKHSALTLMALVSVVTPCALFSCRS